MNLMVFHYLLLLEANDIMLTIEIQMYFWKIQRVGDKMDKKKPVFYIVSQEVLPDVLKKTIVVKELLKKGETKTIYDATKQVGISRSAFYKYKDHIFPFYEASREKIVTLSFILDHTPGILSTLLNNIAIAGGNVLTINQDIPLQGIANVSISIETAHMEMGIEGLLENIQSIEGIKRVEIIGQS